MMVREKTSAASLQLLPWLLINGSILKKIAAVGSSRAPLYSADTLLLLVRSPLKQSMDCLAEVLIATFEHDLSSGVRGALELSETARERCSLSFPLHLLSSPTPSTPRSPRSESPSGAPVSPFM